MGQLTCYCLNASTLLFYNTEKICQRLKSLRIFTVNKLRLSDIEFNVATLITKKYFKIINQEVKVHRRMWLFIMGRQHGSYFTFNRIANLFVVILHRQIYTKVHFDFCFQVVIRIGIIPDASMNAQTSVRTNTVTHSTVPVHMGVQIQTL